MYYKAAKSNLTFNEAIDSFNNGNIIRLDYSIFDPKEVNITELKFSIEQIKSNKWEILVYDNVMNERLYDVQDMMHNINLNIDSRFYHEEKMNISSYWNLFNIQFVRGDDNLQYEFMKFYINNYKK